jgi:hypothetical protein
MESADLKPRKIVLKKSLSTTTTSTTTITISTNERTRESNNKSDGDGDASFNEAATAQQRESSSSDVIANLNEKSNATTTTTMTHEAHLLLEKKLREKLIEAQRSLNEIEQNKDKNGSSCVATRHEKETKGILFDLNKF